MARQYGPANYDPDEVPTWRGIEARIDDFIAYNGYYPGYLPSGYRVPTDLMARQYVSDQLLQETTMEMSRQIDEATATISEGVDATIQATNDMVNDGVQAVMDGTNEAVNGGLTAASDGINGALETVMDTKHTARNESDEAERSEEVYSTAHEKKTAAQERELESPIAAVNHGIDAALESDEDEPSMLEVMGDASWRVGNGITAWADSVQQARWSTAHSQAVREAQKQSQELDEPETGERVYSTAHGVPAGVRDGQEPSGKTLPDMQDAGQQRQWGPATTAMAAAFSSNSARELSFQEEIEARREMQEANSGIQTDELTPEQMMQRQMDRYQQSLELVAGIDFGGMFQRDMSMEMG